jgi:cell division protein FtsI (penicillin-binding protein 3)
LTLTLRPARKPEKNTGTTPGEVTRQRVRHGALVFGGLFAILLGRLVFATVIHPLKPDSVDLQPLQQSSPAAVVETLAGPARAEITDRNGVLLAVSLPGAALYANPHDISDPVGDAQRLGAVLPGLDVTATAIALADQHRKFVYLDRRLSPAEQLAVNNLGIPGVYFQGGGVRHYPEGNLAAHILGGTGIDGRGLAGVEDYFDKRLNGSAAPLVLSIDAGVQGIVRDELAAAVQEFQSPGGCAIVMNAHTGEILAMVSMPDYDVNDYQDAEPVALKDNCVNGDYEPGSVFKLQTVSMALDSGMIHYWDYFDTTHPLKVGRFTVTDFEPVTTWMAVPQILNVSSNIGASRIATILGPEMEQDWLRKQGFLGRLPVQLPGPAMPQTPRHGDWGLAATMTVSFGAGISVSPLHVITGVLPVVNGGVRYDPTLLAVEPAAPPPGTRVMRASTSDMMRKLMTNVVLFGTGVKAAVPGYVVGGKTGTAQVVSPHGGYLKHTNNASFMGVFPMQNPQYVVYVVIFQPKADASTQGFTTGGQVSAPVVAHIIKRIGPMLGVLPVSPADLSTIDASLTVPLAPSTPPGQSALGPGHPLPAGANGFAYELLGEKPPTATKEAELVEK